jgi:hypothetical protein
MAHMGMDYRKGDPYNPSKGQGCMLCSILPGSNGGSATIHKYCKRCRRKRMMQEQRQEAPKEKFGVLNPPMIGIPTDAD